ncbi:MAG: hypothetical protein ACOZAN_05215 [Patescibacteria group bacterium]
MTDQNNVVNHQSSGWGNTPQPVAEQQGQSELSNNAMSTDHSSLGGGVPQQADTALEESAQSAASADNEALETQNVFVLLGISSGTEEEKERFLDELQQVIWDDFVENDVALLVTSEEMVEVKKVTDDVGLNPTEKQEKLIDYLEKLIPDLEEIMLEKALELKEDMVRERINGLRDLYRDDQHKLEKLDEAEQLMRQDKWKSLAEVLNGLSA